MAEQARIDRNYERGHAIGEAIGEGAVNLVSAGWSRHRERKQARRAEEERQRELEWQRQQQEEQQELRRAEARARAHRERRLGWLNSREGRALLSWADQRARHAARMEEAEYQWNLAWISVVEEAAKASRVSRRSELGWMLLEFVAWVSRYALMVGIVLFVLSWLSPGMKFLHRLLWLAVMFVGFPIQEILADVVRSKSNKVTKELDSREARALGTTLRDRYGFDPRATRPWLGPLSSRRLRRQTEAVLAQADAQGRLRYGPPDLEPLYVRTPDERWPEHVNRFLKSLAEQRQQGFRPAPVRPPAPDPAPQTGPDPDARERAQVGRWEYLIEVMARLERAWDHAWAPAVADAEKEAPDGHTSSTLTGRYGLDPRTTHPWEEDLTADDVEAALETAAATGHVGPPPGLTLRKHSPSWPQAVGEVVSMAEEALWNTDASI